MTKVAKLLVIILFAVLALGAIGVDEQTGFAQDVSQEASLSSFTLDTAVYPQCTTRTDRPRVEARTSAPDRSEIALHRYHRDTDVPSRSIRNFGVRLRL